MPAPTVTVVIPPPVNYSDPDNLRPASRISWTGGTGPFDVLHEWDTVSSFDSGNLIQDNNVGATSPDTGVPPSDMGPAGTTWFYRATVTDTSDSAFTVSPVQQLAWTAAIAKRRYLYEELNDGVGFEEDAPAGGWGTGGTEHPDGDNVLFRRYLWEEMNDGVGFEFDQPAGGWGGFGTEHPDGDNVLFRRYLYEEENSGVGFDDTDTPAAGWDPNGVGGLVGPGDGYNIDRPRYLYEEFGDVNTDTPTPHIWYLFPNFGREGWEFQIVGYGFGDTQPTYSGSATLDGLAVGVISWDLVPESDPGLVINPLANVAEPVHQLIRAAVPEGATSGLVIVCTDGP